MRMLLGRSLGTGNQSGHLSNDGSCTGADLFDLKRENRKRAIRHIGDGTSEASCDEVTWFRVCKGGIAVVREGI